VTTTVFITNGVKIGFIVASILILLDLWGMPTTPLMLLLAIGLLIAIFASRDEILNVFAGIEIVRNNLVKTGDYVRLESGEEGYISRITWNNVQIKTSDEKTLLVPNSKFVRMVVTISEKQLKQASQPFRFLYTAPSERVDRA
jgi:small-conductance mechanosensitive channel